MKVNNDLNSKIVFNNQNKLNEAKKAAPALTSKEVKISDSIEISKEAKEKLKALDKQRLAEIKVKIENKAYDNDDILSKVADKILADLGNDD